MSQSGYWFYAEGKFNKAFEWLKLEGRLIRHYGLRTAVYNFLYEILKKRSNKNKSNEYYRLYYEGVKRGLRKDLSNIIKKYKKQTYEAVPVYDSSTLPIWIFWWQGMEAAPDLVKTCYKSVLRAAGDHKVICLDKGNYHDYVDVSENILKQLEEGKISLTHFSDVLRCRLLYQHGGLWIDSTVLVSGKIGQELDDHLFYTVRHGHFQHYSVCKGKWTTFLLMARPKTDFFKYLIDVFEAYYEKYSFIPCYLLIDCFMAIGYEDIAAFRDLIDAVPVNNRQIFELAERLNETKEQGALKLLEQCNYHKLTYRLKPEKEIDGKKTVYKLITEEYG